MIRTIGSTVLGFGIAIFASVAFPSAARAQFEGQYLGSVTITDGTTPSPPAGATVEIVGRSQGAETYLVTLRDGTFNPSMFAFYDGVLLRGGDTLSNGVQRTLTGGYRADGRTLFIVICLGPDRTVHQCDIRTFVFEGLPALSGACVLPEDGRCVFTQAFVCALNGGQYIGDGVSCLNIGACTLNEICSIKTAQGCAAVGGTFDGVGSRCPGEGDADGDGLIDSWEKDGIDVDDDGTIDLDLPAMGADPRRKDIFVEVDWMSPLSFTPAAADLVIDAFAAAPVGNPDASTGITMHIDNGPSAVMNPLTGASWGNLSRGNAVPFISVLGAFDPGGDYIWAAFDAIKAGHFPAERRAAFHYMIVGNRFGSAAVTASGISRDNVASDFLVTLGSFPVTGGTAFEQAGTFMHELGHNLGLRHGHGDGPDINNQPNFLSIMNYAFQHTGLFYNGNVGLFDYSRFGLESLGQLDETALSELNGIQAVPSMSPYKTAHFCAERGSFQLVDVVGPIDWDCVNGTNSGTVVEDINDDGIQTTLDPFNDWSNLVYRGGLIGGLGAGAVLPGVTPVIEPPLSEILETTRVLAPFDLYLDGHIDLRDFALFQVCFASKAGGADGRCVAADFNADAVVDLTDHGPLANALTGP